jgi:hypothetical protein
MHRRRRRVRATLQSTLGLCRGTNVYLAPAFPQGGTYLRRQDVPPVYRINATLYLWRRDYVIDAEGTLCDRGQAQDAHRA